MILNACYSVVQADAITQHIDYVIGMNQAIGEILTSGKIKSKPSLRGVESF